MHQKQLKAIQKLKKGNYEYIFTLRKKIMSLIRIQNKRKKGTKGLFDNLANT